MKQDRKAERTRSLLSAQAVFADGTGMVECTIRNISSTGARLDIENSALLPAEFDLKISNRLRNYHARVVWRQDDIVGVEFTSKDEAEAEGVPASRLEQLEHENAVLKAQVKRLTIELSLKSSDSRMPV